MMASSQQGKSEQLNRGTGLLIIEVRHSNPNGDPDTESDPRMMDADGRGLISPVSFKRKLRDLVASKKGPAWQAVEAGLGVDNRKGAHQFDILETRGRDRDTIWEMEAQAFCNKYWDARLFGNTFLESMKEKGGQDTGTGKTKKSKTAGSKDHFIGTGVVQFGVGLSVAPIDVERLSLTNKQGVEGDKDRGMAPLGWRVVRHAVYAMPFFVNPMMALKTDCDCLDVDIMKFLIPHAYRNTTSAIRPFVEIRHAWYAEHKNPLGSCPDSLILDALTPTKRHGEPDAPSTTIEDYDIPVSLNDEVRGRLASFEDLCMKEWGSQ